MLNKYFLHSTFRSSIHSEVNVCVRCEIELHFFLKVCPVDPKPCVEMTVLTPLIAFTFVKKQLVVFVWVYFIGLYV